MTASCIYEGTVRHRRYELRRREFTHKLALAYIDLDELPELLGDGRGPTPEELEAIRAATFTVEAVAERERETEHDVAAFVGHHRRARGDPRQLHGDLGNERERAAHAVRVHQRQPQPLVEADDPVGGLTWGAFGFVYCCRDRADQQPHPRL